MSDHAYRLLLMKRAWGAAAFGEALARCALGERAAAVGALQAA